MKNIRFTTFALFLTLNACSKAEPTPIAAESAQTNFAAKITDAELAAYKTFLQEIQALEKSTATLIQKRIEEKTAMGDWETEKALDFFRAAGIQQELLFKLIIAAEEAHRFAPNAATTAMVHQTFASFSESITQEFSRTLIKFASSKPQIAPEESKICGNYCVSYKKLFTVIQTRSKEAGYPAKKDFAGMIDAVNEIFTKIGIH